jgi:hypothetical protein
MSAVILSDNALMLCCCIRPQHLVWGLQLTAQMSHCQSCFLSAPLSAFFLSILVIPRCPRWSSMELCQQVLHLAPWKDCVGCLGSSVSQILVVMQYAISHSWDFHWAHFLVGATDTDVLQFRTLFSFHFSKMCATLLSFSCFLHRVL